MPGGIPVVHKLAYSAVLGHLVVRRGFTRLPHVIYIVDRETARVVVDDHLVDFVAVAALGEMAGEEAFNIRPKVLIIHVLLLKNCVGEGIAEGLKTGHIGPSMSE